MTELNEFLFSRYIALYKTFTKHFELKNKFEFTRKKKIKRKNE